MHRFRKLAWVAAAMLASVAMDAQNVPGYGWSSFGILPFRGYDFIIMKAPTQYVLYYKKHPTDRVGEDGPLSVGRAFSNDLKSWTLDPKDPCTSSGALICGNMVGVLQLPDGRMRMFQGGGINISSAVSTDGIIWTAEPGFRLTQDTSSIYERGQFALHLASFVTLEDGSVRMYYEGGVTPGTPGTPAYYNMNLSFNGVLLQATGMILSAISKDNGLTWVKEPGIRVNPLVQGPARNQKYIDGSFHTEVDATDFTSVMVKENGQTVYRLYASSWGSGTVSYVSSDGLSFVLEGQVPADRGDPKAIVLPDGRVWMVTNQYPDAINDTIVYGPQTVFVTPTRADVRLPLGTVFPANPIDPNAPASAH